MALSCCLVLSLLAAAPPDLKPVSTPEFLAILAAPAHVQLAELDPPDTVENFLQGHSEAQAAINGGFFDKTWTGTFLPTGLVVAEGRILWPSAAEVGGGHDPRRSAYQEKSAREARWYGVFLITQEGTARILRATSLPGSGLLDGARLAIECGPLLLRDGKVITRQTAPAAARTAVGVTRDGQVILLATRKEMTLVQLAQTLVGLGAVDALNLDGGPSTSFASRERTSQISGQQVQTVLYVTQPR